MANVTKPVSGYAELLFRFPSKKPSVIRGPADLQEDDYMAIGGAIPLHEYDRPYALYQSFHTNGKAQGLPRDMQEYDIINLIFKSHRKIRTFVVVSPDNSPMFNIGERFQIERSYPHGLVALKQPFKAFLSDYDKRIKSRG